MPELPVNDGYSRFHRMCNFLDKFQPIYEQCYNVNSAQRDKYKQVVPYAIGDRERSSREHHYR